MRMQNLIFWVLKPTLKEITFAQFPFSERAQYEVNPAFYLTTTINLF